MDKLAHPRASDQASIARLAMLLDACTPGDGVFEHAVPGVHVISASRPNQDPVHGLHRPALCIIAQGAKTVLLGAEEYDYDASRMLVFSVDLPVAAKVRLASPGEPYLCFRLDIDPARVAELVLRVYPAGVPKLAAERGVFMAQASDGVVSAAARLLELQSQPDEAALIAPLIVDEILIRLLRSNIGGRLAQIGNADSNVHRIARAVTWVKEHYSQPMRLEDLAQLVHMSPSSFHKHFKDVTSMSPLQYQKVLRLQEARRLMAAQGLDASAAGETVGYVSPSQFSREYARFFGNAPIKDISRLRGGYAGDIAFST